MRGVQDRPRRASEHEEAALRRQESEERAPSEVSFQMDPCYELSIARASPPLRVQLSPSDMHALRLLAKTLANSMLRLVLGWKRLGRHSEDGALAVLQHVRKVALKKADSSKDVLSRRGFDGCVLALVDIDELERAQQAICSAPLDALFRALDRNHADGIDVREFIIAFSVLCGGSKSVKLAFAFETLDAKREEQLDRQELRRLFRSFLTALSSFSLGMSEQERDEKSVAIEAAAVWASERVFEVAGISDPDRCTFGDLATWYDAEGIRKAPWLELLDLRKWTSEGEKGNEDVDT
eukprot:scaffold362_cov246-Pinguiococcus_pyrenoidosus.AAC.14